LWCGPSVYIGSRKWEINLPNWKSPFGDGIHWSKIDVRWNLQILVESSY